MYTRISRSGGRSYLQLVEGYRTDAGAVRQRIIATLGRLDQLGPKHLDPLIQGLNRTPRVRHFRPRKGSLGGCR